MAQLYLDQNVARQAAVLLRLNGHGVRTAADIGSAASKDSEHLTIAYKNDWIFVTHNISDFELLHDAWQRWSELWNVQARHPGILALATNPSPEHIASLIEERLPPGASLDGELWVWRLGRGWQQG